MRQKHYDIDYVLGMITIKQSTREPLQYLVLLWVVTAAVVLAAVLGRLQIIQFNLQWLVDCIALLFLCSIVVMTYRTVFPIDFETVVRPDAVDLSSTSESGSPRRIHKDDIEYFFKWRRVWYRPRVLTHHVRYVQRDGQTGVIGLQYINRESSHEFFDAVRTHWGSAFVRENR